MISYTKNTSNNTYSIDFINGATLTTTGTPLLSNLPVLEDADGKPCIRKGDFNGDGRDELLVVTINSSYYGFNIYDINTGLTILRDIHYELYRPRYVNVGKFDSARKGKDIINFIYTYSNYYKSKSLAVDTDNFISDISTKSLLGVAEGIPLFVNAGDFDGNGTDELNIIYTLSTFTYYRYFDVSASAIIAIAGGQISHDGEIIFTCVGKFSGSNKDELTYVYDHTDGVHQTYRTIDLTNNLQISRAITSTYSTDLTNVYTMGRIIYVTKGDYNGDGKDELTYVFNHVDGVHQTYKTLNVITYTQMSPTSGSTDLTNKGNMGELKVFTSGDYNGDGKDDLGYIYGMAGSSSSVIVRLDPINYTSVSKSFPASPSALAGGLALGPVAKYMSYPDDNYTPLKDPSTIGNYFPIGWYSDGSGNIQGTALYEFNLGDYNTYLAGLGGMVWDTSDPTIPSDVTVYPILGVHGISTLSGNRRTIFDIRATHPWANQWNDPTSIVLSNKFRTEAASGRLVDTNIYFPQPVLGFYIGDDAYWKYQYGKPKELYQKERVKTFNDTLYRYYPSYFTFAAEGIGRFLESYESFFKDLKNFVPMQFDYYYMSVSNSDVIPDTPKYWHDELIRYRDVPNYVNYRMVEQSIKSQKLKYLVNINNQPGYIYIAQAHDGIIAHKEKWFNRNATYKESRYEIYNAIINGAKGILYWELAKISGNYATSNPTNVANLSKITDEITNTTSILKNNGYIPLNGSLLKSLTETPGDFKVYCSKDGYNSDFDDNFDVGTLNGTKVEIPYIGRSVADINYVIRGDYSTGTAYLIAINNSNNSVTDIKFYIPADNNVTKVEGVVNNTLPLGTIGTNTYTTVFTPNSNSTIYYKRNSPYYAFNTSLSAYEVKLFKISGPGSPSPDFMEGSSQEKASETEVTDFALSQNYPNPFNPSTVISYDIPEASRVTLKVYDILGREVADLVNEYKEAGRYNVKFDASHLSTGIYIYQLRANDYVSVKKMSFVK
jgi:hypothetical protein